MKAYLLILIALLSLPALAHETIRLSIGNSVTIQPLHEVRVVCEGPAPTPTVRFCQCRPSLYNTAFADLIQVIKTSSGSIQSEVLLYRGLYFGDCYNAMVYNPNCR